MQNCSEYGNLEKRKVQICESGEHHPDGGVVNYTSIGVFLINTEDLTGTNCNDAYLGFGLPSSEYVHEWKYMHVGFTADNIPCLIFLKSEACFLAMAGSHSETKREDVASL